MSRRAGIAVRVIGVIIIIGLVAVGIYAYQMKDAKKHVKAEIARLASEGKPVTMTDLAGPDIPDNENAAIIYKEIFKVMSGSQWDKDEQILTRFVRENKRRLYPKLWVEAREAGDRYQKIIPLVEEAVSRSKCDFRFNWQDGIDTRFPEYPMMRNLGRVMAALAILDAKDGRVDQAAHCLELGFGISESLKNEPTLNGQFVRIAIINTTANALRTVAQDSRMTTEQAVRLRAAIPEAGLVAGSVRALEGERAQGIWVYEYLRGEHGPFHHSDLLVGDASDKDDASVLAPFRSGISRSLSYCDQEIYLQAIGRQIEKLKLPSRDAVCEEEDPKGRTPKYESLYSIVLPITDRFRSSRDKGLVELEGSRIFLELIACKDRYGAYPSDLRELHSKLNWEVPKDTFSGKDFIYRPQKRGFLLYSIGPNLKDDGGAYRQDISKSQDAADDYDIVWKMER